MFHFFRFSALNFQIITEYGEQVLEETKKSKHSTLRKKGKNFRKLIFFYWTLLLNVVHQKRKT